MDKVNLANIIIARCPGKAKRFIYYPADMNGLRDIKYSGGSGGGVFASIRPIKYLYYIGLYFKGPKGGSLPLL